MNRERSRGRVGDDMWIGKGARASGRQRGEEEMALIGRKKGLKEGIKASSPYSAEASPPASTVRGAQIWGSESESANRRGAPAARLARFTRVHTMVFIMGQWKGLGLFIERRTDGRRVAAFKYCTGRPCMGQVFELRIANPSLASLETGVGHQDSIKGNPEGEGQNKTNGV